MHQFCLLFSVVYSQLPLAAVKPHHFSEVEGNQNSMSSCFIQRHSLWAVFWFTAVLHSMQSVQRHRKYPAVCTKESPKSTGSGLGLFDISFQVTSKDERPGCDCSLKYASVSAVKGRSRLKIMLTGKYSEGAIEIHWRDLKSPFPFWGSD